MVVSNHALDLMRLGLMGQGPSPESATEMIYDLVGADKDAKFLFTGSGAEAIASVHWTAFMELARKEGKCHFITTPVEDFALLQSLKRLEELGCFVKIAPLQENGQVDLVKLAELVSPRTAMISLSLVHGLTGVIQPIEEIAKLGVWLHVDASYALGKVIHPFEHVDFLTFAGDQIHGLPSGAAFGKKPILPIVPGNQEKNIPALLALGGAASEASLSLDTMSLEVARLRNKLEAAFTPLYVDSPRVPNVAVLKFPGVHHEMLQYRLARKNLHVEIGGTRMSRLQDPTTISISLTRFTTEADVDHAIALIWETVASLKPLAEALF